MPLGVMWGLCSAFLLICAILQMHFNCLPRDTVGQHAELPRRLSEGGRPVSPSKPNGGTYTTHHVLPTHAH